VNLTAPELSDQDMRAVQSLIYRLAGIHIADGKRLLVQHRLAKRLRERGVDSYRAYCTLVERAEEGDELQRCVNALTTNETYFFRHKHHWDFIAERILPLWKEQRRMPRAWSAACSTGEEPYSLAILARELMPEHSLVIDATDINDAVLRAAEAGVYGAYALQKATPGCLARYFTPCGDERWSIAPALRALVRFRRANLLEPSSGQPYDLVLLRNVLIYFDEPSKTRALKQVAGRMAPGAWLLIGGAESLGAASAATSAFEYVSPGIYRRTSNA
jgi:chemotaxis protein methyltransferase CheR